ncbi:MAG: hypothetical protein B7Z02_06070 [Rhodobacterales bacterium 32-67-9]|nr:MAG: hypothetical protein B7Z02_06070 [Rhodobacterales bacterium 32-67-9]
MARDAIALEIHDVSTFAQALRRALSEEDGLPGHLGLLNKIARAAGFRNFQQLKAQVPAEPAPAEPVSEKRLAQVLRCFDGQGRVNRWPGKTSHRGLVLWAIWAHLPARTEMSEPEVNAVIERWHTFGDRALLRRSLIDHRLATRQTDGRGYRRVEGEPPAEARVLLRRLSGRDG